MLDITYEDARIRNLKMIIAHQCLNDTTLLEGEFDENSIKNKFYFRISDFANFMEEFFEFHERNLVFTQNIKDEISNYLRKRKDHEACFEENKKRYLDTFGNFRNICVHEGWCGDRYEEFSSVVEKIRDIIEPLHWYLLPVYDEQMIINSDIIPENDLINYYNNYHALEDLLYTMNEDTQVYSYKGDINLNHPVPFNVFSRRWGHDDCYHIKRTINGWYVEYLANSGESEKDGTGAIFNILNHDSIFFPEEGVKYAFETLWNEADNNEMSVDELAMKLQEIADWISAVEKVTGDMQPSWCMYY